MSTGVVTLKEGAGRGLSSGAPWIYDNEIERVSAESIDGDAVAVEGHNGFPLGQGLLNRRSRLTVRMLTRNPYTPIDRNFFMQRVRAAWEYRKKVVDTSSCRLIFGEADFIPGLVVDKFSDVLVAQPLCLGIDQRKKMILECLVETLKKDGVAINGIYERGDSREREREGMEMTKGFISEPFDTNVEIVENGVRFIVDVAQGQKTGFFLDQKANRAAIRSLCMGERVLDCFTHTGSFALNAAMSGALEAIGVDASMPAVEQARRNAALNGLTNVRFLREDVFALLPRLQREGETFGVVILDPPAFAKTRASVKNALRGYREINQRAMRLIRDGGFLATCSCSRFVTAEMFADMAAHAARDAHKRLRQVENRTQAPDHPILPGAEETGYLKFMIFQVFDDAI